MFSKLFWRSDSDLSQNNKNKMMIRKKSEHKTNKQKRKKLVFGGWMDDWGKSDGNYTIFVCKKKLNRHYCRRLFRFDSRKKSTNNQNESEWKKNISTFKNQTHTHIKKEKSKFWDNCSILLNSSTRKVYENKINKRKKNLKEK